MKKEVPLEQNWKHWKEKYEMECEKHQQTRQIHDAEWVRWRECAASLVKALSSLLINK
jgi:hypothetical protein